MKTYAFLLMVALLLACRPAAQATAQPTLASEPTNTVATNREAADQDGKISEEIKKERQRASPGNTWIAWIKLLVRLKEDHVFLTREAGRTLD